MYHEFGSSLVWKVSFRKIGQKEWRLLKYYTKVSWPDKIREKQNVRQRSGHLILPYLSSGQQIHTFLSIFSLFQHHSLIKIMGRPKAAGQPCGRSVLFIPKLRGYIYILPLEKIISCVNTFFFKNQTYIHRREGKGF